MDWGHLGFFVLGAFIGMFVGFIGLALCVAARCGDEDAARTARMHNRDARRRAAVIGLHEYRMPTKGGAA